LLSITDIELRVKTGKGLVRTGKLDKVLNNPDLNLYSFLGSKVLNSKFLQLLEKVSLYISHPFSDIYSYGEVVDW